MFGESVDQTINADSSSKGEKEEDAGEVLGRETIEAMLRISRERMMGFDFRKPNNQQNNF